MASYLESKRFFSSTVTYCPVTDVGDHLNTHEFPESVVFVIGYPAWNCRAQGSWLTK